MEYIRGLDQLVNKLKNLSKRDAGAAIRKGTRAGAKIVQQRAKELSPEKTGALKASLKVRALPRSRKSTGTMVRREIFYGAFLEYGTRHIQARHFMHQAAKEVGHQAQQTAVEAIKEEIERRTVG